MSTLETKPILSLIKTITNETRAFKHQRFGLFNQIAISNLNLGSYIVGQLTKFLYIKSTILLFDMVSQCTIQIRHCKLDQKFD